MTSRLLKASGIGLILLFAFLTAAPTPACAETYHQPYDTDSDGDGLPDLTDPAPYTPAADTETLDPMDTDGDGYPDYYYDSDGDGFPDETDPAPYDPYVPNGEADWEDCFEPSVGQATSTGQRCTVVPQP